MKSTLEVIASCVFVPTATPAPVVNAYMYNCNGNTSADPMPLRYGAGEYEMHIEQDLDVQQISIVARAYNAAGATRIVNVSPSPLPGLNNTAFDIKLRDDLGALTDDAAYVEITVSRLPLV
jgi:hypothetical protein